MVYPKIIHKPHTGIARPQNKVIAERNATLAGAIMKVKVFHRITHKPYTGTENLPNKALPERNAA